MSSDCLYNFKCYPSLEHHPPLIVRELKNAGLAAEEAWRIWQEGFKYVEENKRPTNIGDNPEAAFDR
jgi:hypothetical protein